MGPSGNIDLTNMTMATPPSGATSDLHHHQATSSIEAGIMATPRQRRKLERRWAWWPQTTSAQRSEQSQSEFAMSGIPAQSTLQASTLTPSPQTSVTSTSASAAMPTSTLSAQQILKQQMTHLVQAPVQLEPGTKNLILVRALDKEAPESDQTLLLNVKCQPRQVDNVSGEQTIIPVRLIVTDANDNAPEFIPLPTMNSNSNNNLYVLNVSEATPVGSLITRDIQALDRDSAGPHSTVHYRVEEDGSQHAHLLHFPNPIESALRLAAPLDFESLPSFTITILAEDQGEPEPLVARAQVRINVIDADDQNPKFLDDKYTLVMDEQQQNSVGQNLHILPHNLRAQDGDRSIQAPILYSLEAPSPSSQTEPTAIINDPDTSISSASSNAVKSDVTEDLSLPNVFNIERYLHLSKSSGEIRLLRVWPSDWSQGPLTLVVRATQANNEDRYTLTTLTITNSAGGTTNPKTNIRAASSQSAPKNGIQFVANKLNVSVAENTPIFEKIGNVKAVLMPTTMTASILENETTLNESVDLISTQSTPRALVSTLQSPAIKLESQSSSWQRQPRNLQQQQNQQQQHSLSTFKQRLGGRQVSHTNKNTPSNNNINYQILDDQTDQFGVNQSGEIFLKKTLDYEQRQEFLFRILATYSRFSDICQVQVNVINVNDNKPKFTQPQYNFHLSESKLRLSPLIGQVQAQDNDLRDQVKYSLAGDQAHLFELNPTTGQLSMRASPSGMIVMPSALNDQKDVQNNIQNNGATTTQGNHQLIVYATDSLGPKQNNQTARINLIMAPQLMGRSVLMIKANNNQQQLMQSRSSDWPTSYVTPPTEATSSSTSKQTRSSVATVMASLQHMVRAASLSEMPLPSALLLSALLALLICVLLILLATTVLHFYRRATSGCSKHRSHRDHNHQQQQRLAAASQFRQAYPSSSAASSASTSPANSSNLLPKQQHQLLINSPQFNNNQPNQYSPGYQINQPYRGNFQVAPVLASLSTASSGGGAIARSARVGPSSNQLHNAATHYSVVAQKAARNESTDKRMKQTMSSSQSLGMETQVGSCATTTTTTTTINHNSVASSSPKRKIQPKKSRSASQPSNDNAQIDGATNNNKTASCSDNSLISSSVCSSSAASNSSLSKSTASTSANSASSTTRQRTRNKLSTKVNHQRRKNYGSETDNDDDCSSVEKCGHYSLNRSGGTFDKRYAAQQESTRIQSLAPQTDDNDLEASELSVKIGSGSTNDSTLISGKSLILSPANLNVKSYRKLDSLVHQPNLLNYQAPDNGHRQRLMGLIKEQRINKGKLTASIKWPQEIIPQRVKQLTWDDELSSDSQSHYAASPVQGNLIGGDVVLVPPATCNIGPYAAPNCSTSTPINLQQQQQQLDNSFLFSAPNSPNQRQHHVLNRWLQDPNATNAHGQTSVTSSCNNNNNNNNDLNCCEGGQNNCFDYTIVQSSQFHVDSFLSGNNANNNRVRLINNVDGGANLLMPNQEHSMPMTLAN